MLYRYSKVVPLFSFLLTKCFGKKSGGQRERMREREKERERERERERGAIVKRKTMLDTENMKEKG